jgi:phosphate transport system substrate-binding protein
MFKYLRGVVIGALAFAAATAGAQVRLHGAGASFPAPLYLRMVAEYQKVSGVAADYDSIGSGGGIKNITDKTVDFAASDAPLSATQLTALGEGNVIQVPSCAGAVVPAYNVPGVTKDLNFTGAILADIYMGKITKWNDAAIVAINPDVKLPDLVITPAYRSDGSGTTSIFTNYLGTQSDAFKESVGMGSAVKWPKGQGGPQNAGVAAIVQSTPGAIGYVEENYAASYKITYGTVKNKDGAFIKATPEGVSLAGAGAIKDLSGSVLKANIWNQPGAKAYPISSFTYLIAYKDLNNIKSKEQAQALVNFLWWVTHDGQKLCGALDYAPLDPAVVAKVNDALGGFTFKGEAIKPAGK